MVVEAMKRGGVICPCGCGRLVTIVRGRGYRPAISDAELLEIVTEFRRGLLGDRSSRFMCYAVCAPLQGYLSFIGVKAKLEEVDLGEMMHWWLRLPDGRIIDPTVDQFYGGAPVYIGTAPGEPGYQPPRVSPELPALPVVSLRAAHSSRLAHPKGAR